MKNKIIILVNILLIVVSCKSSNNYDKPTYTSFPEEIELKGKKINLSDTVFMNYPQLLVADSICCIYDQGAKNGLFKIFTYPEFSYKYTILNKGNGANELKGYINPRFINQYLYVFAVDERKIYRYNILNNSNIPEKTFDISEPMVTRGFSVTEDNDFIFTLLAGNYRLKICNNDGILVDSLLQLPKVDVDVIKSVEAWQSLINYNKTNHCIALATIGGEVIDIINLKDKISKSIIGPGGKPKPMQKGNMYSNFTIYGFQGLTMTDNFIYGLFSGVEILKVMEGAGLNNKLYAYDYFGNPIKMFHLDIDNAISVHVDEEKRKIYITNDLAELYEYDL